MAYKLMAWKQPIDTDIFKLEGCTAFERSVWFEIIMRASNKDKVENFYHGNKNIQIELKRGQMIFRVSQFAREQGVGRKRVKKSLSFLQKWYNEMDIETKPYGLIITVNQYDNVVKMDSEMDIEGTTKGQRKDNERTTSNKSVKNIETMKTGESARAQKIDYESIVNSPNLFGAIVGWITIDKYREKVEIYYKSVNKPIHDLTASILRFLIQDHEKGLIERHYTEEDYRNYKARQLREIKEKGL